MKSVSKSTNKESFFESWINFWMPIYKRQVFKSRLNNNIDDLLAIKENIYKNVHFSKDERKEILKKLDIYKLI